jgi:hypothetical protein
VTDAKFDVERARRLASDKCAAGQVAQDDWERFVRVCLDEIGRLNSIADAAIKNQEIERDRADRLRHQLDAQAKRIEGLREALDTYAQYGDDAKLQFVSGALARAALTTDKETT